MKSVAGGTSSEINSEFEQELPDVNDGIQLIRCESLGKLEGEYYAAVRSNP